MTAQEPVPEPADQESQETARVIPAEKIFGERNEVWIEYNGERYRLRITRRGKLLLQK